MEEEIKKTETVEVKTAKHSKAAPQPKVTGNPMRVFGVVFLCFVASFLGSWALLATGIVDLSDIQTVTKEREKLVLQEGEVIADVAQKVSPSVVSIVTESTQQGFFGVTTAEAAGTGIVIDDKGYVLTNKHVIPSGTNDVDVVLANGKRVTDVTVVGRDPINDIAFLKMNGFNASNIKPAAIADSDKVVVGQKVIAIGNALGEFQTTVTSGIISGVGRNLTAATGSGQAAEQLEDLFQTDAAINPGNSGGPLVNLNGEVIGINTAIASEGEGLGFAIPINATKGLITTVTKDGEVSRAYVGVRYRSLTPAIAEQLDLDSEQGAYILENGVIKNGPGDKAGLKAGDIITKVDKLEVNNRHGLSSLLARNVPGEEVTLTVLRNGRTITVQAELGAYQD